MRKGPPSFKVFQPNSAEVIGWRALAEQAQSVAMGKTRGWVALKDMAVKARKLMVFGPLGRGNVCVCLFETAIETAESTEPPLLIKTLPTRGQKLSPHGINDIADPGAAAPRPIQVARKVMNGVTRRIDCRADSHGNHQLLPRIFQKSERLHRPVLIEIGAKHGHGAGVRGRRIRQQLRVTPIIKGGGKGRHTHGRNSAMRTTAHALQRLSTSQASRSSSG